MEEKISNFKKYLVSIGADESLLNDTEKMVSSLQFISLLLVRGQEQYYTDVIIEKLKIHISEDQKQRIKNYVTFFIEYFKA